MSIILLRLTIMRVLSCLGVGIGILCLPVNNAFAHPHAWIDVQTDIIIDAAGNITGLRQNWLFDEFYTEFALADFGAGKKGAVNAEKLQELGRDNLNNLKEYSYFIYMDEGKKRLNFSSYKDEQTSLKGNRINLSFVVLLETPVPFYTQDVSFRIYDPSYYIEMKQRAISFMGHATSCATKIIRPKPEVAFMNMAAALDKNATAPDDLGRFFAERVLIICPHQQK